MNLYYVPHMKATTAICDLLINTPISKCVVGTDQSSKTEEDRSSDTSAVEQDECGKEGSKTRSIISKEEWVGRRNTAYSSAQESVRKSAGVHSFHSVVGQGKNLDDLEESFMGLSNASNELNRIYAKQYMEWIIGYLEEWEKIVSTR